MDNIVVEEMLEVIYLMDMDVKMLLVVVAMKREEMLAEIERYLIME